MPFWPRSLVHRYFSRMYWAECQPQPLLHTQDWPWIIGMSLWQWSIWRVFYLFTNIIVILGASMTPASSFEVTQILNPSIIIITWNFALWGVSTSQKKSGALIYQTGISKNFFDRRNSNICILFRLTHSHIPNWSSLVIVHLKLAFLWILRHPDHQLTKPDHIYLSRIYVHILDEWVDC